MGVKRRRFDPEFRAGAVRIVRETGKPVAQVARDLGIGEYTLHNWVKLDREQDGESGARVGGGQLSEPEREELAELRRLKAEMAREHAEEKEYTAAKAAAACRRHGITQSMGRVGCALANAAAEAFNSTLKVEFAHRHTFTTRAEARIKISTWIADFYNTSRRHSANDGLAPITFEHQMAEKRRTSTAQLRAEVAYHRLHDFRGLTRRRYPEKPRTSSSLRWNGPYCALIVSRATRRSRSSLPGRPPWKVSARDSRGNGIRPSAGVPAVTDEKPLARAVRVTSQRRLLPMPGSPSTSRTPERPSCAAASRSRAALHSAAQPRIVAGL
ncbi:MAG: transposase [Actinoallomurus sp.]